MKRLTERLEAIVARAAEINKEVEEILSLDELTEEQQARFDALETEATALVTERTDINAKIELRAQVEDLSKTPTNKVSGDGALGVIRTTEDPYDLSEVRAFGSVPIGTEMRGRARKAIETDPTMDDSMKQRATTLLEQADTRDGALAQHILATGNPYYRSAWAKLMQGQNELSSDEAHAVQQMRAMSLTTTAGGFMIPFQLDPTIILTSNGATNPLRVIARVESGVTNSWNGVSSAGVSGGYAAEAAQATDGAPTLAQPSIAAEKAQAFIPYSIEAGMDIANLSQAISVLLNEFKDETEAAAFVTGTGSDEPNGVSVAVAAVTASRVAATTNDSFGLVDVYALHNALPARHSQNASWLANKAIYNSVRQFDTNGGAALWTTLANSIPNELLGDNAYESSAMDGALGTGDDDVLLYGDFRKFLIYDRVGLSVEFIPHLFGADRRPTGQRGWYAFWRSGSDVLDANAFRQLRV